jgi:hypothetical protein
MYAAAMKREAPTSARRRAYLVCFRLCVGVSLLIIVATGVLVLSGVIHRREADEIIRACEALRGNVITQEVLSREKAPDGAFDVEYAGGWKESFVVSNPGGRRMRTKLWDPNGTLRMDAVTDGPHEFWDHDGRFLLWERYRSASFPDRRGLCIVRGTSVVPYLILW